jgi:hypothetical protein
VRIVVWDAADFFQPDPESAPPGPVASVNQVLFLRKPSCSLKGSLPSNPFHKSNPIDWGCPLLWIARQQFGFCPIPGKHSNPDRRMIPPLQYLELNLILISVTDHFRQPGFHRSAFHVLHRDSVVRGDFHYDRITSCLAGYQFRLLRLPVQQKTCAGRFIARNISPAIPGQIKYFHKALRFMDRRGYFSF